MAFSESSSKGFKKYSIILWGLFATMLILVFGIFVYISSAKLPDTKELENPSFKESTLVYTTDGKELGRYFSENRQWVTYEELSPHLVNALISKEDERFYQHSGVDLRGIARMFVFMGTRGGASTITQQLAKQFFTKTSKNTFSRIWQKLQEWTIAIEFEKRYTKEEIIAMYLNKYDFLHDATGVGAAANVYFGKDQKDLTIEEAATLIGMLNNARLYNPKSRPENAIHMRMVVLKQLEKHRYISTDQYNELRNKPLDLSRFKRPLHIDGLAPYFRNELTKTLRKLIKTGAIPPKPDGTPYNIYRDGLKIYTTIDSRYQRHAENAMKKHMKQLQAVYFERWKKLDPWKYEATEEQQTYRQNSLNKLVEGSHRFRGLRAYYMNDITLEVSTSIDNVRLWDADIKRMLKADKDEYALNFMNKEGVFSSQQKKTYETIMKSTFWPQIKRQWHALKRAAKKEFNIKKKMTVFSYENGGEKDVFMTPLDSIKYHRMHMQLGSIAIESQSGYVKAWVGGIDYKYFKYDHVTSDRQVGSTFKPFVYTTALMNGYSPCWKVKDIQYTIPADEPPFNIRDSWTPANADGKFSNQEYTLKEAMRKSLNSISVWLIKNLESVDEVINLAVNMGIPRKKIPAVPSLALGVPSLNVLEMTSAYSTFSNDGIHCKPIFLQRVEDKNGNIIFENEIEQRRALSREYNYTMVEMLKYAASSVHYALEVDFGGKTGTTNNYVDGWFIGVTPNLTVGTWVGGDDSWIRFLTLQDGQGGRMARPFFLNFMNNLENDEKVGFNSNAKFIFPGNIGIELDCSLYEEDVAEEPLLDSLDWDDPFDERIEDIHNE
ncbi:MAG: transglycosylase domain-containing protein [Saprospiraceae bacterium]